MQAVSSSTSDFSKGSVAGNILRLALPMTVAQLINVLYSVVDRMYIGRLPDAAGNALTGLGLTFPILSMVTAFANLFGMGGSPLFSMERGRGNTDKAKEILGNTFALLVGTGVVLTVVLLLIKKPLLYAFGASDTTYPYADGYLTIYLCGSIFVMISLGLNPFINAQGFGRKGMMTVLIGAVTNIVLDPLFIFVFDMGVQGGGFGHHYLPVFFGTVGLFLSAGEKGHPPSGMALCKTAPEAGVADCLLGVFQLCHGHHQLHCAGGLQLHPAGLWGRFVRGGDDHSQLGAGGGLHPHQRHDQRRPAGDWL